MSKGKRDALILTLIGLILYGLVYYNFVLIDAQTKFSDIQTKIDSANQQKAALEEDLKNLPTLQRNLEIKNVQNERLEEYLMSEANLADNIEYIDKLAKLFANRFKTVSIGKPVENTSGEKKYYEFGISVNASMTYSEAINLVNYIEGGSRKVKITTFNLKPTDSANVPVPTNTSAPANVEQSGEQQYVLDMAINLYALELANLDKVYEYSRKRFNRFDDSDGVIFVPAKVSLDSSSPSGNSTVTNKNPVQENIVAGRDLDIRLESFLAAGQNFWLYGAGSSNPIKFKTDQRSKVKITFTGNNYDVLVSSGTGYSFTLSGKTLNKNSIQMFVSASFPLNIPENQKLGVDIQIINNSAKKVDISLNDKIRRTKFSDRNGQEIIRNSNTEKVYII